MRNNVILLLLAIVSSNVFADWEFAAARGNGSETYYYDPVTVIKDGEKTTFLLKSTGSDIKADIISGFQEQKLAEQAKTYEKR